MSSYQGVKISRRKRARTCGFRDRQKNHKNLLKRRRLKGRWRLTPVFNKYK